MLEFGIDFWAAWNLSTVVPEISWSGGWASVSVRRVILVMFYCQRNWARDVRTSLDAGVSRSSSRWLQRSFAFRSDASPRVYESVPFSFFALFNGSFEESWCKGSVQISTSLPLAILNRHLTPENDIRWFATMTFSARLFSRIARLALLFVWMLRKFTSWVCPFGDVIFSTAYFIGN